MTNFVSNSEMMPTPIRSSTLGFFSTMCRFGALLAPFSPLLENIYKPLPFICFGGLAIFGGLIYTSLPETLNKKLPNTIEEAIRKTFKIDSQKDNPDLPLMQQKSTESTKDDEDLENII